MLIYKDSDSAAFLLRRIFPVWKTVAKYRMEESDSFYWLLRELVVHGGHLDAHCWPGSAVIECSDVLQSRDSNFWNCS